MGATLPSSTAAYDFYMGVPGSGQRVVLSTVGRAALIGLGLAFTRDKSCNHRPIWRDALGGAIAIELFVLGWVKSGLPAAPNKLAALPPAFSAAETLRRLRAR